jgi:hypothetical protein
VVQVQPEPEGVDLTSLITEPVSQPSSTLSLPTNRASLQTPAEVESREAAEHPLVLRLPVGTRLADAERKLILLTLEAVRGNKQRAARVLGISRRGLYSKLQAYGEHVGVQEAAEGTETEATIDVAEEVSAIPSNAVQPVDVVNSVLTDSESHVS